jgi:RHS repeat-associated protein
MTEGRVSTGHPIDVASGVIFTAWHDIDVPGVVPLNFRRYYSTALINTPTALFRHGWVYALEVTLTRNPSGYSLWGPEGVTVWFEDPTGAVEAGGVAFAFGDSMELQRQDAWYVVYHWHGWREEVQKFYFRADGSSTMRIHALAIPSGHALVFTYAANRLREVRQSIEGRALELVYDAGGRLGSLRFSSPISSPEVVATYEYDAQDRLVAVLDALGRPIRYAYDGQNRLIEEVGRSGGLYIMAYDAKGRGVHISGDRGYQRRTLVFNDANATTRVTDSLGSVTTYRWNARGQIVEQHGPTGAVERTKYDPFGRITARFGPSGEILRKTYSRRGDVDSISYPGGGFNVFEYNVEHQPVAIHQSNGSMLTFSYLRGAMVSFTDAVGATTNFERDADNLVTGIGTSAGARIKVARDAAWSSERYTDDFGLIRAYRFDARLHITDVEDARGLLRHFEFDKLGHLVLDQTPDGQARRFARNALGLPTSYSSRGGSTTHYEYDAYGHRLKLQAPLQGTCEYKWDTEDRLLEVLNPKGERASFEADPLGNITKMQFFDGRVEQFAYDASNRRRLRQKPDGTVLEFSYDEAGNLLGVTEGNRQLSSNAYDLLGQLTATKVLHSEVTFEYDLAGRPVVESQNGERVETQYTVFGTPALRTCSAAKQQRLFFDYDTRRRLVAVRDEQNQLARYEYDAANLLVRRQFATVTEEFTYNSRRRPLVQTVSSATGAVLLSRTFTYDGDDRLTQISDLRSGDSSFAYDAAGRLIRSIDSTGLTRTFEYDESGNLTRKGDLYLTYGTGNRLLTLGATRYEYDPNGNLVVAVTSTERTEHHWNSFDQLIESVRPDGRRMLYDYDGLGRRTAIEYDGKHTDFYWWSNDLLCERQPDTTIDYLITRFIPQALWIDGEIRHIVTNYTFQPSDLIDSTGAVVWSASYDVWGLPQGKVAVDAPARLGFPGQYYDQDTSLHYNRYRYYSALDTRYITPDPLGLVPCLNEYVYGVNPVNWTDPLGLACGQTHFVVVENPNLKGRDGQPPPTRADWIAKRDAFNAGVAAGMAAGTPLTIPTPAQYAQDRAIGNQEAAAARVAQGMGPGVQADHPVDLSAGGGQGQALYPLASGVNGSYGSQIGPQAAARPDGSPTPMVDLVDQNGNAI